MLLVLDKMLRCLRFLILLTCLSTAGLLHKSFVFQKERCNRTDIEIFILENLSRFEGAGVYYSATSLEAQLCKGNDEDFSFWTV